MPWNVFFSIALWCIWRNRNEGVFHGLSKTLSAPTLVQSIRIKAKLWFRAWNSTRLGPGRKKLAPQRTLSQIGWKPPPPGWLKLNVDGASNNPKGIAGEGGLLRDTSSSWVGGFVVSLGTCSAAMSELWALYHGVNLAWKLGCRTHIVENDSQVASSL
ncbi:unnamed protein product [Linum trigynum]|uniref:RNase H type-1 domain-containing protein n=1 Tax=Linum trigynum TaxID=586398 RepID=A0AAV2EBA3_9ROSI